jgi:hypothetical protein
MSEERIDTLQNVMAYDNGIKGLFRDLDIACARQYARWRDAGPNYVNQAAYWQRCWDIVNAASKAADSMWSA